MSVVHNLTYEVRVDWDGDGDFLDADEIITDRVMEVSCQRGRDFELDRATAGTASFRLRNDDGRYTPTKLTSPLFGKLKPGRLCRIQAAMGDSIADAALYDTPKPGEVVFNPLFDTILSGHPRVYYFDSTLGIVSSIADTEISGTPIIYHVDVDSVGALTRYYWKAYPNAAGQAPVAGRYYWKGYPLPGPRAWKVYPNHVDGMLSGTPVLLGTPTVEWYDQVRGSLPDTALSGTKIIYRLTINKINYYWEAWSIADGEAPVAGRHYWKTYSSATGPQAWRAYPNYSNGILSGTPILITALHLYGLFYGTITEITPHPHPSQQTCFISCVDGFDFLNRAETTTPLLINKKTGFLIETILDDVGWPTTRRKIDTGQDTVPLGYWRNIKSLGAIQELESTEMGFIYIDGDGNLVWEDRHHRLKPPHTIPQVTIDTMRDISSSLNLTHVYNEVRATMVEKVLGVEVELWRLPETPFLAAGQTAIWWADFPGLATNIITPVAVTDYKANTLADGTGDDRTANISVTMEAFAETAKLTLTNTGTDLVYITLLRVRGDAYSDGSQTTRKAVDSSSQLNYNKRVKKLDGKFLNSIDQAQDYCDFVLARFKEPHGNVKVSLVNQTEALLTQILVRKLSDRVRVINTQLGLDDGYFINKQSWRITEGGKLIESVWTLRAVDAETFWCLGYSGLGTETTLAY